MDWEREARAVVDGADRSASDLKTIAAALRESGRTALVAEMLTVVARRALDGSWRPAERAQLAIEVLRDHQQFGYARRLLSRLRVTAAGDERLRQQHALCTYKDLELPARDRLDQALRILAEGRQLERIGDAETLGIAGAICRRRWEVDAKRVDLENALWCYRRGFEQKQDENRWYAGINAAFVAEQLAALEDQSIGVSGQAEALREEARRVRLEIVAGLTGGDEGWNDATLGEALFGLDRFDEACEPLAAVASKTKELWRQETTATQLAALARMRGVADDPRAIKALAALVGDRAGAVRRVEIGKVGVALSGGGFRASLFHIGVLARLAECNVLRHVEVLSCVSGGSIVGAFYYLKLRRLLERKLDGEITDADYVTLVQEVADEFLVGVQKNLRRRLGTNPVDDAKMLLTKYTRTDRAGELFEELFFRPLQEHGRSEWRMPDLMIGPAGRGENFALRYENWLREAKVPILVFNATTLNTGHPWQFTASWMGESPTGAEERVDASRRLRRVYYRDAPNVEDLRRPTLGKAVAASACVPGLFPPIKLERLYDGIDVELVDGGVYDNQGIASLLDEDCTVILASDASGQPTDDEDPSRWFVKVLKRSNSILMKRVRAAQYRELHGRERSGTLRGLMAVHLTKGLPAPPRDWSECQEPRRAEDDGLSGEPTAVYGIDPKVQRAMAVLRTDLDAFSDDEAYSLMAAGYLMTAHDLPGTLPDLAQPERGLLHDDWPFAAILKEMTSGDAQRLADALRWGDARFLRRSNALLHRLGAIAATLRGQRDYRR
jgi:predicted acylesterase/phospholipase RssA